MLYIDLIRSIDITQEYYSISFKLPDIDVFPFQKIYIRPSYKEIYDEIFALVNQKKTLIPIYHRYIITGVPGIGKTQFLPYFICRFLRDTKHQSFFIQTEGQLVRYYDTYGITEMSSVPYHLKHVPLFADIKKPEPAITTNYMFIFSSPDPARFKQDADQGYKLVIPISTYCNQLAMPMLYIIE